MIEKLNTNAEQKIAVGGDFNVAIVPIWTVLVGIPLRKILSKTFNFDLVDMWRVM